MMAETSFRRIWVSTEIPISKPHIGDRHLDYNNRKILEYTSKGWKTLYSNKTCMRLVEVVIMDWGITKII